MPQLDQTLPRTITSSYFCAAYLLYKGFRLDRIVKNDRNRVSFVFVGDSVKEFKRAYRDGEVKVRMGLFRENYEQVRSFANEKRRNALCPDPSLMQSSRA